MPEEAEVEVIEVVPEKETNHFDNVTTEQYIRYCIFEEYIRCEFRGESSIKVIDQFYDWVMDKTVPSDPKKRAHLKEIASGE